MTEFTDLDQRIIASSALGSSDDFITGSAAKSNEKVNRAEDESTGSLLYRSARTFTAASGLYHWAERSLTLPDPDFNLDDNYNDLTKDLPDEYKSSFNSVRSMQEGMLLRQEILQDMEDRMLIGNAGFRGKTAAILGSIVDLDSILTVGTGGLYAAPKVALAFEKAGLAGSRVAKIGTTAVAGAELNATLETINAAVRPTNDWTQVPDAALNGLVFGGVIGAVLPKGSTHTTQENLNSVKEEFAGYKEQGFPQNVNEKPVRRDYEAQMAELEKELDAGGDRSAIEPKMNELAEKRIQELKNQQDSVGAASQRTAPLDPTFRNQDTSALLKEVREANVKDGLTGDKWDTDTYFKANPVSQTAKKLHGFINKTPWASDFDYLFNSGSVIGQRLATQLFESPSGVAQMVNRTSAIIEPQYRTEIMVPVAEHYSTTYSKWLQENKSTTPTPIAWNDINARQTFDRAVMHELQYRYHDGVSAPTSTAAVRQMADAIDQASARAAEILKGRNGEVPVKGSEELKPTPGWYRQVWSGKNILDAITRAEDKFGAKNGKKLLQNALSTSYQQLHKWDKKTADIVAKAVLNNSIARSDGVNTNLFRTMTPDNFEYLREVLKNDLSSTRLTEKEIDTKVDALMQRIKIDVAERGKIKPLKERNDVDLRTPITGTDMTLMDLIDADINKTWTTYSRTVAGAASTARNGIQPADIRARWIPAIKDELQSRGAKPLAEGFYEALETYFSGRAYSNGINPWLRRLLSTTNLAFLNSLGVTQLGELGAGIASMKLDNFLHAAPKEVKAIFNGKLSPVHEDLKNINSSIIGDHNIYRPELMQNETRGGAANSELERNLDSLLAKGSRAQGFISGFYKVNQWMQRMAGNTLINRMGQLSKGKGMDDLRKASLGFTPQNESKILGYFKDGTVEFRDGTVYDLHVDKWDYAAWQEFASIINRHSGQAVQKAFRGEDAWWMHKDTGAFLMHLKSFTFTAMHKQLIRNMRIADSEALATFLFGLGSAAAAYTARQYLSGNQEKMTGEKLLKGTLNYSNITAPIVTFTDPMFGVLGMNDMQVGSMGNAYSGNNSLLAMPPSFNAVNRIAQIPSATVKVVTGNHTKSDIYALQAAPIFGNLYGMGYIANAMRDDLDRKKRQEQKVKKEQEPKPESQEKVSQPAAPKSNKEVINQVVKLGEGQ